MAPKMSQMKLKRIELDSAGIESILKSQEMLDAVTAVAERLNPGEGYEVNGEIAQTRAAAWIETTNEKSYQDNLENNTLLKARNGGGKK